jgi:predicted Zn finger-like uncharacterized protein
MQVICSNCEARLQLDETKMPSETFKVRCPKCQMRIDVTPPPEAAQSSAAEVTPSSSKGLPFQLPVAAAQFKPAKAGTDQSSNANDVKASPDLAKLLAAALRQNDPVSAKASADGLPTGRKALVCTSPAHREGIAKGLVTQEYDVFVAEDTEEALGRMRDDRIDVLILESNFDQAEQGFAFVSGEVKSMRPPERRRLFLIYVTPAARTMDLHAAFLHNANLVVNPADVERLPDALEVSLRHYNELYRDFNHALGVTAI